MNTERTSASLLQECSALCSYRGLDAFRSFAASHPSVAFEAVWTKLAEGGYLDDDGLCTEWMEILISTSGPRLEDRLRSRWESLAHPARLNFIAGVGSRKATSTELATFLFHSPTNDTKERHWIVSRLAAGDPGRDPKMILALAKEIGVYSDPDRQRVLDQFVQNIEAAFAE